ncbi:parathyroid hormone 2 receptor [Caerostris extrusa]|uniref:Parathyroid hormone 2 receptor n=1 Tax=Caerostris extrusa TaxID=172846 RepID=A0AAV4TZJ6_CAEEX|nr:parathyroid hormone 2 receptor [Caerostris extrusa]
MNRELFGVDNIMTFELKEPSSKATASKLCSENGTWWVHPDLNQTWSNYSLCGNVVPFQDEGNVFVVHIPVGKEAISQAGYSVSLTLLLIACLLLGSVRRLRCPRNNLHLQLFASFILRAAVSLFRDMTYGSNINEGTALCKALTSVWQYCLMANYCWILMEGLYLHNLVFLSMFTDTAGILKYGILGWGLPLFFIIPWIIVKAILEDILDSRHHTDTSFYSKISFTVSSKKLSELFPLWKLSGIFLLEQPSMIYEEICNSLKVEENARGLPVRWQENNDAKSHI